MVLSLLTIEDALEALPPAFRMSASRSPVLSGFSRGWLGDDDAFFLLSSSSFSSFIVSENKLHQCLSFFT